MITQQLLEYIRQNQAAGISKSDIEKTLLASGWAAKDIADAFTSIEHPGAVVPPVPTPQVSKASDEAAEVARIQHEVELEMKRQKVRGAAPVKPATKGIIGWLISHKIVAKESEANVALLGVAVLAAVMAVGIFIWSNSGPSRSVVPFPMQGMNTAQGALPTN